MLPLRGLHVKQRESWVPNQHLLYDWKTKKNLKELVGLRTIPMQTNF
jgi:hypothetical protein